MVTRRQFLHSSTVITLGFLGLRHLPAGAGAATAAPEGAAGYGPLVPDPAGLLDLPRGFSYRTFSRMGEEMSDGLRVPGRHDGMAAFAGPNGTTILVRNHEVSVGLAGGAFGETNELLSRIGKENFYDFGFGRQPALGGTTTIVYNTRSGRVERQHLSLAGTLRNCAGGPTPWGSWITCEETVLRAGDELERDHGYNFEVPARADGSMAPPLPLKAMGRFNHEAIAVDPPSGIVYQTEDRPDGIITRFVPREPGRLQAGGTLQALVFKTEKAIDTRNWTKARLKPGVWHEVEWMDLEGVDAPDDDLRLRAFEAGAARFARGEGMWHGRDGIYFACTNGGANKTGQVFRYRPSAHEGRRAERDQPGQIELFVEPNDTNLLEYGDNLTVAPWGDILLCEDGAAEDFVVGVTPKGEFYRFARNARSQSEVAGGCFSPVDGTFFVNLQSEGLTLAITGPWKRPNAG